MHTIALTHANTEFDGTRITYRVPNYEQYDGKLMGIKGIQIINFKAYGIDGTEYESHLVHLCADQIDNKLAVTNPPGLCHSFMNHGQKYIHKASKPSIVYYNTYPMRSQWMLEFRDANNNPLKVSYDELLIEFVVKHP